MQTLPTPPSGPRKRCPANLTKCFAGKNRTQRKAFCLAIYNDRLPCHIGPQGVDPIFVKRLKRESRHMLNAYNFAL